jgi:hypothetical protein
MSYRLPTEWIQHNTIVVNVASYKNVDEAQLLQIPGVIYIPQVGKVTVAMLERNVMRLFDQFHHPDVICNRQVHYRRQFNNDRHQYVQNDLQYNVDIDNEHRLDVPSRSWIDVILNRGTFILSLYAAVAVTALLTIQIKKSKS